MLHSWGNSNIISDTRSIKVGSYFISWVTCLLKGDTTPRVVPYKTNFLPYCKIFIMLHIQNCQNCCFFNLIFRILEGSVNNYIFTCIGSCKLHCVITSIIKKKFWPETRFFVLKPNCVFLSLRNELWLHLLRIKFNLCFLFICALCRWETITFLWQSVKCDLVIMKVTGTFIYIMCISCCPLSWTFFLLDAVVFLHVLKPQHFGN
jgi:hypothetical protein